MFGSSNCFLLLPIAAMLIPVRSSVEVICYKTEAFVHGDVRSDQNSEFLDKNQYTDSCDRPLSDVREVFFGCKLKYIPQNFLGKFVGAKSIDMTKDWLQTVKKEDFRENSNLIKLRLEYNQLTQLPAYLFNYTPKIEEVDFSANKIETIDPNTFAVGVDYLRIINLSANQIKTLDGRTFANAVSLTEIKLDHNQIDRIGLKLVKFYRNQPLDSQGSSSLNCLTLPYVDSKFLIFNVRLFVKNDTEYRFNGVEIDCDTTNPYWYFSGLFLNIDGVKLAIDY